MFFHKLVELEGIQQAGKMRLVSKAWLKACTQYPADVACSGRQSIKALSKALPHMTSFRLLRQGERDLSLEPLRALTQLTRVEICHIQALKRGFPFSKPADMDLMHLPSSIAHLELLYVCLVPADLSTVSFTGLRSLTCTGLKNAEYEIWAFLSFFQQLQASALLVPQLLSSLLAFTSEDFCCRKRQRLQWRWAGLSQNKWNLEAMLCLPLV